VVRGEGGELLAALFVTRTGTLPPRDWIAQQLAADSAELPELLAGRPAKPMPDRGALVCVCFDVREQDILAAIAGGATNVAEVGKCTRAGTNCGSCRTITARLLDETMAAQQEAAQ